MGDIIFTEMSMMSSDFIWIKDGNILEFYGFLSYLCNLNDCLRHSGVLTSALKHRQSVTTVMDIQKNSM